MGTSLKSFLKPVHDMVRPTQGSPYIVLSSRVRLARNLQNLPFPGHAKKNDRLQALQMILPNVQALPQMQDAFADSMDHLDGQEKQILMERHLISREHAAKSAGSGLVLSADESLSVMVNEEDHLRMQSIRPGLEIDQAWQAIQEMDDRLELSLPYAFDPKLGYLTACPSNLGTGIRVSAMLHLPGLVLAEQINQIIQAINKLGLAVRGFYGEGTDALGNIFQISNQRTLGESEAAIIQRLKKVINQAIQHEEDARQKLLETKPKMVLNHVSRAYGTLSNAYIITSKETMNLLSLLRLGVDFGWFSDLSRAMIDELFLLSQPAHLQDLVPNTKLSAEERDMHRADLLRKRLEGLNPPLMLETPSKE